jgi:hypothetical protein
MDFKFYYMKQLFFSLICFCTLIDSFGQSDPVLLIDGSKSTFRAGISLPYWLKEGQSIGLGSRVKSVSAIEFITDSVNLRFYRVLNINSTQTVPSKRVWKLEAIALDTTVSSVSNSSVTQGPQLSNGSVLSLFQSPKTFSSPGSHSWVVPPGITKICVELWGAGGRGSSGGVNLIPGSGGGGGGYGYQCITVVPGTVYSLKVGFAGGDTATGYSSFSNLFRANAGKNAVANSPGSGGTANTTYAISGGPGANPVSNTGGVGGAAGNGGAGGFGGSYCGLNGNYGSAGVSPGGGGGGGCYTPYVGAGDGNAGADGRIIIYW